MKIYTKEFKQQVLELAESLGSVTKASEQLGVPTATIYGWKGKFKNREVEKTESEEVIRLRKEVAELKKVNHILKQAAAFFSQDQLK